MIFDRTYADALGCQLAGEVLRRFGRVRVRVTGTSMIPAVWPGDVVVVERREVEEMERGEIALALREGRLVAHRVVSANATPAAADSLTLRGDAQLFADQPLHGDELLGAVIAIERGRAAFEPARCLNFFQQALAALAQRSSLAARVLVRLHQISSARPERVALCPN